MLLRLLRQLVQVLIRFCKTTWNDGVKLLFAQFIRRWAFVFKLVESHFIGGRALGRKGEQSKRDLREGERGRGRGDTRKNGAATDSIAFSLHPYSFVDRNSPQLMRSPSSSSDDTRSLGASSSIAFTVQPPQSPTSGRSGEGENIAVVPSDSPRLSIQSLEAEGSRSGRAADRDHNLEVPRRAPTRASARSRSNSPSARSPIVHPAMSSTSLQPRPYTPSHLHFTRPSSPLARSLRPIPSRTSIHSQSLVLGTSRPVSVHSTAPEPLEIIEPPPLTKLFEDEDDRIYPVHPEDMTRYSRKVLIPKEESDITLEPLTMSFKAPWEPEGWQSVIHPEGVLYFWHQRKRILTEAYLYDHDILQHLLLHLAKIETFLVEVGHQRIIGKYDLVLDMSPSERGGYVCGYYFVNHEERTVFWLSEYQASYFGAWNGVKGVKSKTHLKHEIEAQYWYHCQLYPTTVKITLDLVMELRDIILHNLTDTMTCPQSTSPISHDDLNKTLGWVNGLKKNLQSASAGSASLLSRLMFIFARERFNHFFGQPGVRLNREISVHGTVNRRTLLIRILSPLLFSAPIQHLSALEKLWVDKIMHEPTWKVMIGKFNKQWEEFILFATVMLNANVAFLAIQSVDIQDSSFRQPAQIASYLSVVASIGSIIIGLLLIKMNRIRLSDTAPDAYRFLQERSHPMLGLETLAILYSLPYATLMWSMVAFLIAFCCICFQGTSTATRGLVGTAFIITGVLVAWCIWVGWDKRIYQQPAETVATGVIAAVPTIMTVNANGAEGKGSDSDAEKSEVGAGSGGQDGNATVGHHQGPDQNQNHNQNGHQPVRKSVDAERSARRTESPAFDPRVDTGAADGSRHRGVAGPNVRVWSRVGEKWKGIWPTGGLNLGALTRWRGSEDSGATAVAV